jgi:quercetin dioxygenase-like cupin family protein
MKPVLIRIRSTPETAQRSGVCVAGDEYLYVIDGAIEVSTHVYAPVILNAGDSIYLDSRMEHAYAAAEGCAEATALLVCSERQPSLMREASE